MKVADTVHPPTTARRVDRSATVIALALLLVSASAITRGVMAHQRVPGVPRRSGISIGAVTDSARFVHIKDSSARDTRGHFMVTTITSGQTPGQFAAGQSSMHDAQRAALIAAASCLGAPTTGRVTLSDGGVNGPSGGLLFALTVVDAFGHRDLAAGRRIAATGTITPNGRVGEVGGVRLKAQAAERAHADVFVVPATQSAQAIAATHTLRVVGVRALDEAVRLLGGTGCAKS